MKTASFGFVFIMIVCGFFGCAPLPAEPDPEEKQPRYHTGQFVEHFLQGKAVIVKIDPYSCDYAKTDELVLYSIKCKDNQNRTIVQEAWEHELKPIDLPDYPPCNAEVEIPVGIDMEAVARAEEMELRIEKKVLQRLTKELSND